MSAWRLARRRLVYAKGQTALIALCIATALALPVVAGTVVRQYERELAERAAATPLVIGPPGSRTDLVLAALHFLDAPSRDSAHLPAAAMTAIAEEVGRDGITVPLHLGFRLRGAPLVGTYSGYFAARGLFCTSGTLPLVLGDVVLGAELARTLDAKPGDRLFSDPVELHGLALPSAFGLNVTGVLAPAGTPDDRVAFCGLKTIRVLDGTLHGHDDPAELEVVGSTDDRVVLSGGTVTLHELTEENRNSFHMHADPRTLPISAILVFPPDQKTATIIGAREDERADRLAVVPRTVIDELTGSVLRVKRLVDALAIVLGVCTILLVGLVLALDLRMRRRERETLHRIGCPRGAASRIMAAELALVLGLSIAFAGVLAAGAIAAAPDLAARLMGAS